MGKLLARLRAGLSLYVRTLAWLHTAPRLDPKVHGADAQAEPRIAAYRGRALPLPHNPAPRITQRLLEIGPVEMAGMDRAPIGWASIEGWKRATGAQMPGWEARLLRRLSAEYLAETHEARDPYAPAPWVPMRVG